MTARRFCYVSLPSVDQRDYEWSGIEHGNMGEVVLTNPVRCSHGL